MNKLARITVLYLVVALVFSPALVLGQVHPAHPDMTEEQAGAHYEASVTAAKSSFGYIGIAIGAGLAAIGGGIGIGVLSASVVDASARQPEMAAKLLTTMFIAAALIEGLALFAIVICILCLFM